jgi:hypothetical protein
MIASTGGDVEVGQGANHHPVNHDPIEALLHSAAARAATAPAAATAATAPTNARAATEVQQHDPIGWQELYELVEQFQAKHVRANTDFAATAATDQRRRV